MYSEKDISMVFIGKANVRDGRAFYTSADAEHSLRRKVSRRFISLLAGMRHKPNRQHTPLFLQPINQAAVAGQVN